MDFINIISEFNDYGVVQNVEDTEYNKMLLTGCCAILKHKSLLTEDVLKEVFMLAKTGRFAVSIDNLPDIGVFYTDSDNKYDHSHDHKQCGGCGGGAVI